MQSNIHAATVCRGTWLLLLWLFLPALNVITRIFQTVDRVEYLRVMPVPQLVAFLVAIPLSMFLTVPVTLCELVRYVIVDFNAKLRHYLQSYHDDELTKSSGVF